MNYYALIPLAGLLITVFVWTYIFAQPQKNSIRRAYLLFSGCLCIWLAMNFILWLPLKEAVLNRLMPLNALSWLPMGFLFYNFVVVYLKQRRNVFFYGLMGVTGVVMILSLTTPLVVDDYHRLHWGPAHYPGTLYLPSVLTLIVLPIAYGAFLVFNKARMVDDRKLCRQYLLIIWGVGTTLVLGIASEMLPLYLLKGRSFVPLGSFSTVVLSVFVFFAVIKYRFLTFNMEDVAEELFARVQDGVVITDRSQRILRLNPAAKTILHWGKPGANLRRISEFFNQYSFDEEYNTLITELNPEIGEGLIAITQSNLDYGGTIHGKILILRDVTEMMHLQERLKKHSDHMEELVQARTKEIIEAHQRLKASEEKYRVLIENNFGLVYELKDGFIMDICPNSSGVIGYRPDEIVGRHIMDFIHPDDIGGLTVRYYQMAQGQKSRTMIFRFLHKNGEWRWIESTGRFYNSLDDGTRVLYIARDVTEHKHLEEEMIKANKLQSVGVLAGGIAHDFNNILGTIWGRISLALTHMKQDEKAYAILKQTETGFNRAKDLTQQLLTFAKGGAPIKKPISIAELIKDAATFTLRSSNVVFELASSPENCLVEVDIGQMNQVFSNLIINAEQAMPMGGVIHINVDKVVLGETSEVPLEKGSYVRIDVRDEGIGIEPEYISRIFDPYFTTKITGSGLGLTTAYSIIQRHGGMISVCSEVSIGTTFTIYLPALDESMELENFEDNLSLYGQGKILIMDDDLELCSFLLEALAEHGYEVVITHHGEEALSKVKEALAEGEPFDLLLMDLKIPGGMGGKETIKLIHRWDPDVKAIVSSGYSDDTVMGEYRKYGFSGVLPKPYPLEDLLSLMARVLMDNESVEGNIG